MKNGNRIENLKKKKTNEEKPECENINKNTSNSLTDCSNTNKNHSKNKFF
jgi:hypothetical protein